MIIRKQIRILKESHLPNGFVENLAHLRLADQLPQLLVIELMEALE